MKKIGLEKEMFLVGNDGKLVQPGEFHLPIDDCGYLVEIRGEPSDNPYEAAYSLMGKEMEIKEKIGNELLDVVLVANTFFDKRKHKIYFDSIRRGYVKGIIKSNNLYGKKQREDNLMRAGLHVHFSDMTETKIFSDGKTETIIQYKQLNIPEIVRNLDIIFKKEINAAKRIVGEYELKEHGFEYRSLPNNMSALVVAKAAFKLLNKY